MTILLNDVWLLRGFREGDREALAHVYWAYVDKVEKVLRAGVFCSRATSFLPGLRPGSADLEDLVQEVFIRAFAPLARRSYDGVRPYEAYVLTIARNVLADWWRRRRIEIPAEWLLVEVTAERGLAPQEESPYADARTMELVERYICGLPADLRGVHEKRFVQGLSQRQAAVELGMSRQMLRTLETRLTARLRAVLDGEEVDAPKAERLFERRQPGPSTETT